jgi:apolipoprotein N-acyltransferase
VAATLAAETRQRDSTVTPKRALAVAFAIILAFVGALLKQTSFTETTGAPLTARLVQGSVDQGMKFDARRFEQAHAHHTSLATHQNPEAGDTPHPDLILLPETIIARLSNQVPAGHWQDWIDIAVEQGNTILLGAPLYGPQPARYTNSVIAIDAEQSPAQLAQGMASQRYDKHHLVPFGEFVPTGFRWFIDLMQIPTV